MESELMCLNPAGAGETALVPKNPGDPSSNIWTRVLRPKAVNPCLRHEQSKNINPAETFITVSWIRMKRRAPLYQKQNPQRNATIPA